MKEFTSQSVISKNFTRRNLKAEILAK